MDLNLESAAISREPVDQYPAEYYENLREERGVRLVRFANPECTELVSIFSRSACEDFGDTGSDEEYWDVEEEPDIQSRMDTVLEFAELHEEARRSQVGRKKGIEEGERKEDKKRRLEQYGLERIDHTGTLRFVELGQPYNQPLFFVYVDGCFRRGAKGGYGAILCDSDGKPVAAAAGVTERPISVLFLQLLGVNRGLELARKYGCERVEVRCNSKYAVAIANGSATPADCDLHTYVYLIVKEIVRWKSEFAIPVAINPVDREANKAADHLAKLKEEIEIEPHEFSSELRDLVCEDVKKYGSDVI